MGSASSDSLVPGRVLISEEELAARVRELGASITVDYAGRAPLLIGVLKGAFMFMSDLARVVDLPVEFDFMAVSSYGHSTRSSGVVRIVKDLDLDLADRDVYLRKNLMSRTPASLEVCALLVRDSDDYDKSLLRYVGFRVPDDFLVGYGLDVAERYRNLTEIRVLDQDAQEGSDT